MKILILSLIILLAGCTTAVPVKQKFPEDRSLKEVVLEELSETTRQYLSEWDAINMGSVLDIVNPNIKDYLIKKIIVTDFTAFKYFKENQNEFLEKNNISAEEFVEASQRLVEKILEESSIFIAIDPSVLIENIFNEDQRWKVSSVI